MKDQNPGITTPSSETPKPEGSFLTAEPKAEAEVKPEAKEGDPKPEDEKKPEVAPGAPEKYADFKLPEGFKFDEKAMPEILATFKDLNLPQESAQKLVDLYATKLRDAAEAPYREWANLNKSWLDEIGTRFGSKADAIRNDIKSGLTAALPPTLVKNLTAALDLTGAGSHPDIVEALSILIKPHLEGRPVIGGKPSPEGQKGPAAGPISVADAMYGHLRK